MRLIAKVKLGFYPLPVAEGQRIRRFLRFPGTSCAAIDPCIGDGVAFAALTNDAPVLRYGIDSTRIARNRPVREWKILCRAMRLKHIVRWRAFRCCT